MTHRPVHEWFRETAARQPEARAIERAGERLTYADLDRRVTRLAVALQAAGVARGSMVGILADDPITVITAVIAVLRAGGVFVPIDPRTPDLRLQAMVAEVGASWFVSDTRSSVRVVSAAAAAGRTARVVIEDEGGDAATGDVHVPRGPDDPCYVYFTSGSTGRPKGILGRLKAIDHFIQWELSTFGLGAGVRVSQLISPSFDAFLRDIFAPLCAGGTVCIPDAPDVKFDATRLARWMNRTGINLIHCVPSLFRTLLTEVHADSFPALRHVLLSGEALLPVDVKRWSDVFGDRVQLVNLYGPSETTMTKFFYLVKPEDQHRPSIPIGGPMDGARALLIDTQGHPCPRGVVGEIYIRTPYSSLGYYGRDELTREVFVQNPVSTRPGDVVYRTGDLARVLEDGTFELHGQRDHQVKIRGERVELTAVENALRGHEGLRDVAVMIAKMRRGRNTSAPTSSSEGELDVSTLKDFLAREFPPIMVPTAWVKLDRLPRTDSDKIDRQRLPPPAADCGGEATLDSAGSPLEQRLAGLFMEVLGARGVGLHDNFFELGGHSLLATQLVSRIRAAFDVDLPVRSLFDAPTVAGVARQVDLLQWATRPAVDSWAGDVQEVEV